MSFGITISVYNNQYADILNGYQIKNTTSYVGGVLKLIYSHSIKTISKYLRFNATVWIIRRNYIVTKVHNTWYRSYQINYKVIQYYIIY